MSSWSIGDGAVLLNDVAGNSAWPRDSRRSIARSSATGLINRMVRHSERFYGGLDAAAPRTSPCRSAAGNWRSARRRVRGGRRVEPSTFESTFTALFTTGPLHRHEYDGNRRPQRRVAVELAVTGAVHYLVRPAWRIRAVRRDRRRRRLRARARRDVATCRGRTASRCRAARRSAKRIARRCGWRPHRAGWRRWRPGAARPVRRGASRSTVVSWLARRQRGSRSNRSRRATSNTGRIHRVVHVSERAIQQYGSTGRRSTLSGPTASEDFELVHERRRRNARRDHRRRVHALLSRRRRAPTGGSVR